MFTSPDTGRSRVASIVGGVEITIPTRAGFHTAFLGAWLGGWVMGEVFALTQLARGEGGAFLVFWLSTRAFLPSD
ncbi:MAG: hypothetical protein ACREON_05620 [Gemmatimonadaceae bacterium]